MADDTLTKIERKIKLNVTKTAKFSARQNFYYKIVLNKTFPNKIVLPFHLKSKLNKIYIVLSPQY